MAVDRIAHSYNVAIGKWGALMWQENHMKKWDEIWNNIGCLFGLFTTCLIYWLATRAFVMMRNRKKT